MSSPEQTVAEAAATDDRVVTLVALRGALATAIDTCDSLRDMAALSRQMTLVLGEIAALAPPEVRGDAVDEIAARRSARRSGPAKGVARAEGAE